MNKWDLIEKDTHTINQFEEKLKEDLKFMDYFKSIYISAKTGQRVDRIFELVNYVNDQAQMRISTGMLNDVINDATNRVQPPSDKGKRLKIFYITQASVKPPTFVLFVNDKKLAHFSYIRYLENQLRNTFGFEGTPIRFIIRERSKED